MIEPELSMLFLDMYLLYLALILPFFLYYCVQSGRRGVHDSRYDKKALFVGILGLFPIAPYAILSFGWLYINSLVDIISKYTGN